jgi:ATP-dependent RNA helicase RhlE
MQFDQLALIPPLLRAIQSEGYLEATPIQEQAIPHALLGRDILGVAQTGTGKTAAFALPILQHIITKHRPQERGKLRALIVAPTRELATQIGASFVSYGAQTRLKVAVIYGGVSQRPQVSALVRGVDILVATPGRLLDLINQNVFNLNAIEIFVMDEVDRMLDMGFVHDMRKIIAMLPAQRQTMMFSATVPSTIKEMVDEILNDPVRVEVTPTATTVERITQAVYFVDKNDKRRLLEHILTDRAFHRVIVFTRTKHGANKLAEQLVRVNITADAIHGNKSQNARERALSDFKAGKVRVLVATDIAARGIDVDGVSHVINFDLPNEPESYVHRIGRTARAGAEGSAISFCDADERTYLREIEWITRQPVPIIIEHPFVPNFGALPPKGAVSGYRRPTSSNNGGASHSNNGNRARTQGKTYGTQTPRSNRRAT